MRTSKENLRKKIAIALFFLMGVFASGTVCAAPDATMIIANPGQNANTEMRIAWHTATSVTSSSVEYTKKSDTSWANSKTVSGTYKLCTTWNGVTSIISSSAGVFTQTVQVNKFGAVLSNLEPNTEYMYRVGSVERETRYFKTAGASTYSFVWMSDSHVYDPLPGRLTNEMNMVSTLISKAGTGGVNFMFSTGDDVAFGGSYTYWQNMFAHAHYKNYMWVTMIGNHDHMDRTDAINKDDYFKDTHNNPQNGFAGQEGASYWFKYSNVLWIILNSMDQAVGTTQVNKAIAWLKQVVAANPSQYIFVAQHYNWFTGETGATAASFTRWYPTFDECGVDIAFAGNNHVYVRTKSLYNGAVNTDPTKGTYYLQAVSSDGDRGATLGTFSNNTDKIVYRWADGVSTVGGSLVTVSDTKVNVKLYDKAGTLLDQADIPAKRSAPSSLPIVNSVSPTNLSAVSLSNPISLTFNNKMDRTSVQNAITISPTGTLSYTWASDYTVNIDISKLNYSTAYTLTVNGSTAKDMDGKFLAGNGTTEKTNYVLNFTTVAEQKETNIFASGLKASQATSTGAVQITYTLNADASAVTVNVENNSPVSVTGASNLLKGTHTVTINLTSLPPTGGSLSWSVTATGAKTTPPTYAKTVNSNDAQQLAFYFPRGVAVDNSFESPYFGNIYVSEGRGSEERTDWSTPRPVPDTRKTKTGIYALSPGLTALFNSVTSWADSLTYNEAPGRISVGEDGKVYIANNTASVRSGVWILNPASPASFLQALATPATTGIATNHGRVGHCYALGTGANTKLYTVDIGAAGTSDPSVIYQYNIGNAASPWTAAVSATLYTYSGAKETRRVNAMAPGKNGSGWWLSQACNGNGSTSQPAVAFISGGSIAFNSGTSITSASGVMAISPDGSLLAMPEYSTSDNGMGNANVRIYSVSYSGNTPTGLTYKYTVDNGSNVNAVAFDVAHNLYTISNGDERLKVYALNKTSNACTTNAPGSQKITKVEGPEPTTTEYYVPNNPNNGKTWYSTLKAACDAINAASITDDITLWVNGNISSVDNVGLVNNTTKSITIKPVSGMTPIIEFTKATANAGPAGAFVIGAKTGLANTDVAPAKNIILDGLIIKTTTAAHCYNNPITIADACDNITITNCTIEHLGAATAASGTYTNAILLTPVTTAPGQGVMPKNVKILKNKITNAVSIGYTQAIGFYTTALVDVPKMASGVEISDNIITSFQRGIFFDNNTDIIISNNEFHIKQGRTGVLGAAIHHSGAATNVHTFNAYVRGNRFIELTSANVAAGNYGIRTITTGGANSTWYIENNYFTGFGKTAAASTTALVGIRLGGLAGSYIRHNTFHLNAIKSNAPTGNTGTGDADPIYCAISIAAGTPTIQNNLFVSDEDAFLNFFVRGTVPSSAADNIVCLQGGKTNAKLHATGTFTGTKEVTSVVFKNAAAGDLSLSGASEKDANLKVPRLASVLKDIAGTDRKNPTFAGAYEVPDPVGINAVLPDNGVRVICTGNLITIIADAPIQSAKLFDLQGRMLESKQDAITYSLTAPAKGVYIVETITKNGRNVQKVAVR